MLWIAFVSRDRRPPRIAARAEGWPPDAAIQATVDVFRIFDWDQESLFDKLKQNVGASELKIAQKIFVALLLMSPATAAVAGPAEDANAAMDR